jgi:hypothetical protein
VAEDEGEVERILSAIAFLSGTSRRSETLTTAGVLRRVKRLIWFALVACVALIGTIEGQQDLAQNLSVRLALAIILVASWAIVMHVTAYLRSEEARRQAEAEAARLEGARMTASAMQDRIANKLSLTVGYAEFLVTDPRLPDDLREHAQRAMDGARAAAEQMSELKRVTRQEYDRRVKQDGDGPDLRVVEAPGAYDSDRLQKLMAPLKGDST